MENKLTLYKDPKLRIRYICALVMILFMVGTAEIVQEKEIIFPEMAALTIGMWIVDKRVWRIRRLYIPVLLTIGACFGLGIVLYSPFSLVLNVGIAFLFAGACLFLTRASLYPLISACVLPVLLKTESWVYPLSVFIMSLIITGVQKLLEKGHLRNEIIYEPIEREWKKDLFRWFSLFLSVSLVAFLAVHTANFYFIIPPLMVSFVEFVNSKAGFRNRPVLTILLLITGALIGCLFQLVGYYYLGIPEIFVALGIFVVLFTLFEWLGKFFAPVGALALIPMVLPRDALTWLPLQVAIGAILFIGIGLFFFQQCYKWSRAQLVYCLIPHYLLSRINNRNNRDRH